MNMVMILIFVVASLGGGAVMVWALKRGQRYEADLQALANARSWAYAKRKATSTAQGYVELLEREQGWTLRIFYGGRNGRSSFTQWTDPSLAVSSGLAVYAAPLPEKTQAMFNVLMSKSGSLGRVMLDSVFRGLGPAGRDLCAIDDDDPATLMATPGAEGAFDPLKGRPELEALNRFGDSIADVPFLVRNTEGLSLRINKRLGTAEDVAAFADTACVLASKFRGCTAAK